MASYCNAEGRQSSTASSGVAVGGGTLRPPHCDARWQVFCCCGSKVVNVIAPGLELYQLVNTFSSPSNQPMKVWTSAFFLPQSSYHAAQACTLPAHGVQWNGAVGKLCSLILIPDSFNNFNALTRMLSQKMLRGSSHIYRAADNVPLYKQPLLCKHLTNVHVVEYVVLIILLRL